MSTLSHHDSFFKAVLQQPERAREYFRLQLPPSLVAAIDLESLAPMPDSFVDDQLRTSFSDLVFSVRMKTNDEPLFLSLLLEHKSSPDPYVTIQLGHYPKACIRMRSEAHFGKIIRFFADEA